MRKIIIIFFIFITTTLHAQVTQQWVTRYNSTGNLSDTVIDMEVDNIGNVYILGYNQAFITIKYNSNGVQEWVRNYKGPSQYQDKATDMVVDDSGNVYVTGTSITNNQSPYHAAAVVIKYSPAGDTIWTLRFENADSIGCSSRYILLADSGNVFLTAECSRSGQSEDITALKITPSGNISWEKYFDNFENDDVTFSCTDQFNNLYISGLLGVSTARLVLKYDSEGNEKLIVSDTLITLKTLVDNELNIFTGGNSGTTQTSTDIGLAKYDSTGNFNWIRRYHNNSFLNNDFYRDFTLDEIGNSYITGVSAEGTELAWDIAIISYNPSGDTNWVQRYDSVFNSNEEVYSITVDSKGNTYVAGSTNFRVFGSSYLLIGYDSTGIQKFVLFYNNNLPFFNHSAKIVKTDSSGNIYVSGVSSNSNGDFDIATIKYSLVTNLNNLSNEIPILFDLHQNYPNPFNPSTKIKFDVPKKSYVKLSVYNTLGQQVGILAKEQLNLGSYEYTFNGAHLPSGIYFYRLEAGEFIQTRRMVLVK